LTEEMSETRRVSFQNKFDKLERLVGFILRIYYYMCDQNDQSVVVGKCGV